MIDKSPLAAMKTDYPPKISNLDETINSILLHWEKLVKSLI
jgi:hypothetical protein